MTLLPEIPNREARSLLPKEELVSIIVQQQIITQLIETVNRLKVSRTEICPACGCQEFVQLPLTVQVQQGSATGGTIPPLIVQPCCRHRSVIQFFQSALIAKSGGGKPRPSLLPRPST